jgi:hypothetical protein
MVFGGDISKAAILLPESQEATDPNVLNALVQRLETMHVESGSQLARDVVDNGAIRIQALLWHVKLSVATHVAVGTNVGDAVEAAIELGRPVASLASAAARLTGRDTPAAVLAVNTLSTETPYLLRPYTLKGRYGPLDRDHYLLRFAVTTSVVSGLTAAAIIGHRRSGKDGLFACKVPLWFCSSLRSLLCADIGKVTALVLARMGAHVAIIGRDGDRAEETAREIREIRGARGEQVDTFVEGLSGPVGGAAAGRRGTAVDRLTSNCSPIRASDQPSLCTCTASSIYSTLVPCGEVFR